MGVYTPELAHQLDKLKDRYLKERDEARAERDLLKDELAKVKAERNQLREVRLREQVEMASSAPEERKP